MRRQVWGWLLLIICARAIAGAQIARPGLWGSDRTGSVADAPTPPRPAPIAQTYRRHDVLRASPDSYKELMRASVFTPSAYRERAALTTIKPRQTTLTPPALPDGRIDLRNLEEVVAVPTR